MATNEKLTQLLNEYEHSVKCYLFGNLPLKAKRETASLFKEIEKLTNHDDSVFLCHERSLPHLQKFISTN